MHYQGITALNHRGAIGAARGVPWHIAEDLKQLKRISMFTPCVMGRKTFEELKARKNHKTPLHYRKTGRFHIVFSNSIYGKMRDKTGIKIVSGMDEFEKFVARKMSTDQSMTDWSKISIFGGAQIYDLFWQKMDELWLTVVDKEVSSADTYFPREIKIPDEWEVEDYSISRPNSDECKFYRLKK